MANPQKENGHTALANELWDALAKYRLSGEEWKCLIVIIRKTYGWHKKSDLISLSQFSKATDMKRQSVYRALKSLSAKMLIGVSKNADSDVLEYRLHKDFEKWHPVSKKAACKQKCLHPVSEIASEVSAKMLHTKETLTKETIQKKKDIDVFAEYLLDTLKIPLSDKAQTEELIKKFSLDEMIKAVNRMNVYFETCKASKWKNYIIGKHWRNLYQKIDYFISDENLYNKLSDTEKSNIKQKPDCRTVSNDFSSDEEIMRRQREAKNVQ